MANSHYRIRRLNHSIWTTNYQPKLHQWKTCIRSSDRAILSNDQAQESNWLKEGSYLQNHLYDSSLRRLAFALAIVVEAQHAMKIQMPEGPDCNQGV